METTGSWPVASSLLPRPAPTGGSPAGPSGRAPGSARSIGPRVSRGPRPVEGRARYAAFFFASSKNCSSSVEPFSAAVDASRSIVVVTASK